MYLGVLQNFYMMLNVTMNCFLCVVTAPLSFMMADTCIYYPVYGIVKNVILFLIILLKMGSE